MLEQGLHSYLVGRSSTSVAETVYRHEIRPTLTKGPTAMNHILKAKAASLSRSYVSVSAANNL